MSHSLDQVQEQIRSGDDKLLEELFREYEPYLRRMARNHLSTFLQSQIDSADLVQSAWVRLIQGMPNADWKFDDRDALRKFLVKILRNRAIDQNRKLKARQERDQKAGEAHWDRQMAQPQPSEVARAAELWDKMLIYCPPQHREILLLKKEGTSLEEIARQTGLHPGSVRRILYQLARKLALQSVESVDVAGG